jgi:hypothetical protein
MDGGPPAIQWSASATFQPLGCTVSTEGDCLLKQCVTGSADAGPPPSAGEITFTGGLLPPGVKISPPQYKFSQSKKGFDPGQIITIKAAGADVPPFEKSLVAPGSAEFVVPDLATCNFTGCGDIDTTADFEFRWANASGPGKVTVLLVAEYASTRLDATCIFEPSAGKGIAPKALLQKLKAISPSRVLVSAGTRGTERFAAGNYDLVAYLLSPGPVGMANLK